jgi:hypothetical protein
VPQSKRHPARRPQQRKPKSNHRPPTTSSSSSKSSTSSKGSKGSKGSKPAPPPATGFRAALERRSALPLALLHQMPSWLVPVLLAVFLLAGLAIPGAWAAVFLALVAVFLIWLVALAWPVVSPRGRVLRVLVIVALVGATVAKALGKL